MEFDDISVCSFFDKNPFRFAIDWFLFSVLIVMEFRLILDVTLQFQADPKYLYDIVLQFKDFEGYKKILYATGRAAVHDTCAQ